MKPKIYPELHFIHNNDNIFSIHCIVLCGSINENDKHKGISHFLEHIKFKSNNKYSKKEFKSKFQKIGGVWNAFTTKDLTCYYIKCIDDVREDAIALMYNLVFNTKFTTNDVEFEKKIINEEKKRIHKTFFQNHKFNIILDTKNPYYDSPIGYMTHVNDISKDELKEYDSNYYCFENCKILINCSKKDKLDIEKYVKRVFKSIKCTSTNEFNVSIYPNKCDYENYNFRLNVSYKPVKQFKCVMTYKSLCLQDEYVYVLDFIKYILSANTNSLLMKILREKEGLIYTIYIANICYIHIGATSIMFTTSSQSKLFKIIQIILRVLKHDILTETSNSKRFQEYKKSYLKYYEYELTDNDVSTNLYINALLSNDVEDNLPTKIEEKINNLKRKEFQNICKTIFDVKHLGCAVEGNFDNIDDVVVEFKQIVNSIK